MEFNKKVICIILLTFMFLTLLIVSIMLDKPEVVVSKVYSPTDFVLNNNEIKVNEFDSFDAKYTEKNLELAKSLNLTEDEAFILGNFGKYWTKNLLEGRKVKVKDNNLIFNHSVYKERFENSAFCIKNQKPCNKAAFEKQLTSVRRGKYIILDLDTEQTYPISKKNADTLQNYIVVRKSHIKTFSPKQIRPAGHDILYKTTFKKTNFKIIVSDLTTKTMPDRNCSSDICKEILSNINNAKESINMAIYGYSSTPVIEKALKNAISRGVKIRVIYDLDAHGENIYPDTSAFMKNFVQIMSDKDSAEAGHTMHNKFYIFDNKTIITGSANLSHTDMSGFNSNSIIVIHSPEIAKFYTDEFNQMFEGKFHNDKNSIPDKKFGNISVFFSPQDKGITNCILPLIRNAKSYIYIPSFVITEKRITNELIKAKQRGVDVKIIADALNSSTKHSKSKELRAAGILVKAENYAGKMHSKSIIVDDKYVILGSMNFSNSGENRNDENLIMLEDSDTAKFYKEFFIYQWNRIPDKWLKYTPRAEGKDSIGSCSDGIDNNYDGKTDKEDEACRE